MKRYDSHTHTTISPDGKSTAADMAATAKAVGLDGFCITNHCDVIAAFDIPEDDNFRATSPEAMRSFAYPDMDAWVRERDEARGPGVSYGLEIGSPYVDKERSDGVIQRIQPDFIIGSIHPMRNIHDFYYIKSTAPGVHALLAGYFGEMLEMADTCDFDVLGHLTYPWRYMHREGLNPDVFAHEDQLRALFGKLTELGRGIEINTSGLRYPFGRCMPELEVVKLYRECGGEVLTVGSDAHRASDVGAGLETAHEIAKAAGFTRAAFYRGRQPEFYAL